MTSPDLFTLPHKALRAWFDVTAIAVGGLDLSADGSIGAIATQVRLLLNDVDAHGSHEDDFIVPLLDDHLPELAERIRDDHNDLRRLESRLHELTDTLERAASPESQVALYRNLRRFAARNLAHLDFEEVIVMPALARAVPDGGLLAVLQSFKAARPESVELYRRVPESITPSERSMVFG